MEGEDDTALVVAIAAGKFEILGVLACDTVMALKLVILGVLACDMVMDVKSVLLDANGVCIVVIGTAFAWPVGVVDAVCTAETPPADDDVKLK